MSNKDSVITANRKTALTFQEKIIAAYLHYVQGIDQHIIAIAMGGVNHGRVNEACKDIKAAAQSRDTRRAAPDEQCR